MAGAPILAAGSVGGAVGGAIVGGVIASANEPESESEGRVWRIELVRESTAMPILSELSKSEDPGLKTLVSISKKRP